VTGQMTSTDDIIAQLQDIMIDVFDVDDLKVDRQTSAEDIEEWDSLSHVRLIVASERKFGVKIESLKTVGDLADLIAAKSQ
jgi:acyl carrier protein